MGSEQTQTPSCFPHQSYRNCCQRRSQTNQSEWEEFTSYNRSDAEIKHSAINPYTVYSTVYRMAKPIAELFKYTDGGTVIRRLLSTVVEQITQLVHSS